jgi:hypothetical protein
MYFAQIKNPYDKYPEPCGVEKLTDTSCEPAIIEPIPGSERFSIVAGKYMYLNGYEILITAPNEGLLYLPLIKSRVPVEWDNLTVYKNDEEDYGCVTEGEARMQGSVTGAIGRDLHRQVMALLTQGPGSFSGKFGEALDSLKASALAEMTVSSDILKYSKSVETGINEWKSRLNAIIASDTLPPASNLKLSQILDSLNIQLNILQSIEAKPIPIDLSASEKDLLAKMGDAIRRYQDQVASVLLPISESVVVFYNSGSQFDGLSTSGVHTDSIPIEKLQTIDDYEKVDIFGYQYIVPWLMVPTGKNQTLAVQYKKKTEVYLNTGGKLTFRTSNEDVKINNQRSIEVTKSSLVHSLVVSSSINQSDIFAKPQNITVTNDKGVVVGKIKILTGTPLAKQRTFKVVYLNHGEGTTRTRLPISSIQSGLNKYNEGFVKINLEDEGDLDVKEVYERDYKANFKDKMHYEQINALYSKVKNNLPNNLIIVTNFKNEPVPNSYINGVGSPNGNCVIMNTASMNTFIHEIGHVMDLRHVFCCHKPAENGSSCQNYVGPRCIPEKSSTNIMDYQGDNADLRDHFIFYQWKRVFENAIVITE